MTRVAMAALPGRRVSPAGYLPLDLVDGPTAPPPNVRNGMAYWLMIWLPQTSEFCPQYRIAFAACSSRARRDMRGLYSSSVNG